ncbi:MAG: hypothetical protein LUD54_02200, partial [Oscillospiraceae bacterium]|nr:hypothetical protein [Oscillospiraceae bacterium]
VGRPCDSIYFASHALEIQVNFSLSRLSAICGSGQILLGAGFCRCGYEIRPTPAEAKSVPFENLCLQFQPIAIILFLSNYFGGFHK